MNLKLIGVSLATLFLIGCAASNQPRVQNMTFTIDGGGTISLPVAPGGALPAENEDFKIEGAGTMVTAVKGDPEGSKMTWAFNFSFKGNQQVESVTVEQVTFEGKLVPLVSDQSPKFVNKTWVGRSEPMSMTKTAVPYLYDQFNSTFLFKFTINQAGKPPTVMYQPSVLHRQTKATYLKLMAQ